MAACKELVQPKQIDKVLACPVCLTGFTTTVATSDTVTTVLGTALSSAAVGGGSVPLVVSPNDTTPGVITTAPNNRVEIWDDTTKLKIEDGAGNEVYGRITEAAGVYTLSYYSLVAGAETAFTFDGRDIEFCFNYRFTFKDISGDCILYSPSRNVNDDPTVNKQGICYGECLTVTALNTLSDLTYNPSAFPCFHLTVNGVAYCVGAGGPASITGKVVTWNPTDLFDLEVGDCVCIKYHTLELC